MSAQIDTTVAHCKFVEGLDIIAFAFEQLSMKQRVCLVKVMNAVFTLSACKEDLYNKDYNKFIVDLNYSIGKLKETQNVCL